MLICMIDRSGSTSKKTTTEGLVNIVWSLTTKAMQIAGIRIGSQTIAGLIIRECANVAADHDALDIYEEIREHFGVE